MQDHAQSDNTDDRQDVQSSAEDSVRAPSKGAVEKEASVLKQLEQRNRQKARRRKVPPWALKVVRFTQASKQFIRQTLPDLVRKRRREIVTAFVSFLVHVLVFVLLAAWLVPESARDEMLQLIGVRTEIENPDEQAVELIEIVQPEDLQNLNVDSAMQQMLAEVDKGQHRADIESLDMNDITLPLEELKDAPPIPFLKGEFGGRSEAGRRAAVAMYGGSVESEKSVSLGLDWLQKIQQPDGSWSFDKVGNAGQGGSFGTTDMGATSLALLCYLGAGNTHKSKSKYQETIHKGLSYLVKNAERGASGADLRGRAQGNSGMYVQGIATICICEAAALERNDKDLKRLAPDAVRFIERAQNKIDGGWRYQPGDAGDTSVVGWQVMALQSAKASRIRVNADTTLDVKRFLNSVQSKDGALYAYMPGQGPSDSMTAVGLLCRMYLGWKRDNAALKVGVEHLAKKGPRRGDIYYNYYATQVIHHWGGDLWNQWNLKMREELVSTQIKEGPGAGSWDVTDPHGSGGGRIYQTALSLLTLEVYYRHLPIYRRFDDQVAEESAAATAQ